MPETDKQPEKAAEDREADKITERIIAGVNAAMKPLISEINASGQIRREAPVQVNRPAPIEDVSDDEIDAAVAEGKPISPLLRRRELATRQRMERELIDPIRQQGGAAIGSVAALAADKLPHYKRFKKDIDAYVREWQERNPGSIVTPDHYKYAHDIIVGQNTDSLLAEAREAAIRERDNPPDLTPTGRVVHDDTPKEAESLTDLLGGDWKKEFRQKSRAVGNRSDDEELAKMGFRGGFTEYRETRKLMESIEETSNGTFFLDRDWSCKEHGTISCARCRRNNAEGEWIDA